MTLSDFEGRYNILWFSIYKIIACMPFLILFSTSIHIECLTLSV